MKRYLKKTISLLRKKAEHHSEMAKTYFGSNWQEQSYHYKRELYYLEIIGVLKELGSELEKE